MTNRVQIHPDWPWSAKLGNTPGIRIGDTIFTSGILSLDPDGKVVGKGDVAAQSRQIFENIRQVLAKGGATMDDVVKITTYLTDMSQYREFSAVRAETFSKRVPTSTAIATPALVLPEFLVEIEAIAIVGSGEVS